MKVGMNSQCLRIIGDNKVAFDYNITDGTTASKFMKYACGKTIEEDDLKGYDSNIVSNEDAPMTWGTENDKMTDITYVDASRGHELLVDDEVDENELYGAWPNQGMYANTYRSAPGSTFRQPVRRPVKMSPPPPRHDYSKTSENEKNFKNLFGK